MTASSLTAALFMYSLPETAAYEAAWWDGLSRHLRDAGVADVPAALAGSGNPMRVWQAPNLLLSQTCGFPLTHGLAGRVRYVATPRYRAPGCVGANYSSRILVRADDRRGADLEAYREARFAYNEANSQSGLNALRAALAEQLGGQTSQTPFFAQGIETGGHRKSIASVRAGEADICAVDAVTHALLDRYAGHEVAGLQTIAWSPSAPGLPFITASTRSDAEVAQLQDGLAAAFTDDGLVDIREGLLLDGLSVLPGDAYAPIGEMARRSDFFFSHGLCKS
jgi:ABC-type phosphate/phosphonate transport system substrate-binding protein